MVNPIHDIAPISTLKNPSRELNKLLKDSVHYEDSVSLSTTSKQIDAIKKSLHNLPEVNEARVLYFKAEIELGNYQVDSDSIAKKMLNKEIV